MIESPTLTSRQEASGRKRAWHTKTTTGCRTCKTRRVKCDETRPMCLRCSKAGKICEGYPPPRKAWVFDPHSRSSSSPTSEDAPRSPEHLSPTTSFSQNASPGAQKFASDGPGSDIEDLNSSSRNVLIIPHSLSGPYEHRGQQYLFKYFLEVAGPSIARSEASTQFWLNVFPQVAWHLKGTRYALLAMSVGFDEASKYLFADVPVLLPQGKILAYESQAMSSVVKESLSAEGILITSSAFWLISLMSGDYARSLQHSYYTQKILRNLEQPLKCNSSVYIYCDYLSRASLEYFRATRGPCPQHLPGDLVSCEASCYVPENKPLRLRVANTLYHLRQAWPQYLAQKELLNNRAQPHSQSARILETLDKTLREIRFLMRRWSDHTHLKLPPDFEMSAKPLIPFTSSPFRPILDSLRHHIENDQASAVCFSYLELQTRVTQPTICIDTSRRYKVMQVDLVFILFHGSAWGTRMRQAQSMKKELVLAMMED